ncbi:MAG: alpha/beta fold hydrolase [Marinagarivorans sp.]
MTTLVSCHRQTAADLADISFSACTPPKGHNPIPESGCAFIRLPENLDDPNGPQIELHFLRIKAINARPQADPLVLIQGGPGGSSQIMAYSLHRYFASVRQNRDLLFVDLRGTGESNPLNCQGLDSITSELNDQEALHAYRTIMQACAQQYAQQAPYYSTDISAADLDTLRRRLGYTQFNLWGASYGTRVALNYAVQYPAFARSLVLDGLAPSLIALPRHIARDANAAFTRLNQYCQSDPLCQQHYGDLTRNAEHIRQHLQTADEANTPEHIGLPDPLNQKPKVWVFTPRRFAQLLISALYSRELTSLLPRALQEAAEGNYQLLGTLSALAEANTEQLSIAEGLYYSIICNEDLATLPSDPTASPLFMGVNLVEEKLAVCASWPKTARLTSQVPHPKINHTPTFLLSGALDPVTPKPWADLVALTQLNHQMLEVPGGNHVVSPLGCIPNLIAQFINTPTLRLPTECSQAIAPLPFYLGADPAAQENRVVPKDARHD